MRVAPGPASVDTELARVFPVRSTQSPVTSMVAASKHANICALADGSHLANVATRRRFPGRSQGRVSVIEILDTLAS